MFAEIRKQRFRTEERGKERIRLMNLVKYAFNRSSKEGESVELNEEVFELIQSGVCVG